MWRWKPAVGVEEVGARESLANRGKARSRRVKWKQEDYRFFLLISRDLARSGVRISQVWGLRPRPAAGQRVTRAISLFFFLKDCLEINPTLRIYNTT